jgi:cytochrome P450
VARDPLGFLTDCARHYGDITSYRVVNVTSFLLNHPDHIKSVLVDYNRHFVKGRLLRANRLLLGEGLATSEGRFWLRQRRMMQPAFHRKRIEGYGDVMVEYANRLGARWLHGSTIDLHQEMNRLAQQIAAKTLFDADLDVETEGVGRAFKVCLEEFQARSRTAFLIPVGIPTPGNIRLTLAVKRLNRVIFRLIRERRTHAEDRGDLLSMLLTARDEEGNRLSDRQLRDEVMTIFLAGRDPVGFALTWIWYLLSQHPRVEEKLFAELSAVLGGRAPRVQDLEEMPYTEMVVKGGLASLSASLGHLPHGSSGLRDWRLPNPRGILCGD